MIAVRAVGTVAADVGAITPGVPAGIQHGDVLLLFIETGNQAVTVAGWQAAPSSPANDALSTRISVFWKRIGESEPAPTTSDSGDHQIGRIVAFSGVVRSGNPFNAAASGSDTTADTTGAIPGAVVAVPNCMVVAACTSAVDGITTTEFSGWTNSNLTSVDEQIDNGTDAGNGGAIGVACGIFPLTGSYGTTDVTLANNSRKALWSGALIPDHGFSAPRFLLKM